MSNQLDNRVQTLAQMLAANRLTKTAGNQEIKHTDLKSQNSLGQEQNEEVRDLLGSNAACAPGNANRDTEGVDTPPNCQNLNRTAEAALSATGTGVDVMTQNGEPTQIKTAADYRHELARTLRIMNKQAAFEKDAAENFRTGTEVMQKFASLNERSTDAQIQDAHNDLLKLASYNPMFQVCRDRILMQKLAADIEELSAAEGISPDDAAAALDAAAEQDPSMLQDAEDEATGEAVAELADAEGETEDLMQGVQQLADNASAFYGEEVSPEDVLGAIDEVEAQAAELGVPPEALIQEAMDEMQLESEITPEDEQNAQAILEEAAANGISPDEVIQMAAEDLEGGAEEAPAEEAPAEAAEPEVKEAAINKKASTSRAAYVQYLLHGGR